VKKIVALPVLLLLVLSMGSSIAQAYNQEITGETVPPIPPVADADGPYDCDIYETILLDGSGSHDPDGSIVSYDWTFGDGTAGTGVKVSHTYSSTGTYTVTLTVTDNDGLTGSDSTTVTVSKQPSPGPSPGPSGPSNKKPKADAGLNVKISVGSTIYFSGADSYDKDGEIVSYNWDFGDGTMALGVTVSHVYSEPGHYTVTLTVKDNKRAEDSDKCMVFVWKPPAPVADKFGEFVPGEQKGFKVDAMEAANTLVTLNTTEPITITVLRYEENPHPDDPMPPKALPIYVDVEVSNSTAVEWPIYVEVHYTDEEVEGLDEDSLGIYYWMDGEWRRCGDTGVDTERNVVWAYMTEEEASGSPILIGGMHAIITPPLPPYLSDLIMTPEELELGGGCHYKFPYPKHGQQAHRLHSHHADRTLLLRAFNATYHTNQRRAGCLRNRDTVTNHNAKG
jgi:PKD repeat protein